MRVLDGIPTSALPSGSKNRAGLVPRARILPCHLPPRTSAALSDAPTSWRLRSWCRLCPRSTGGLGFRDPGHPQTAICQRDLGQTCLLSAFMPRSGHRATLARGPPHPGQKRGSWESPCCPDLHGGVARRASDQVRRPPSEAPSP